MIPQISSNTNTNNLKIHWLSELASILSLSLTKISVLLFFRRLDNPCSTALKRLIYGVVGFTAFDALSDALVLVFQCQPIQTSWTLDLMSMDSRRCISKDTYYLVRGFLGSFTTTYAILIPVLVLRHFPMTRCQRHGLQWVAALSFWYVRTPS